MLPLAGFLISGHVFGSVALSHVPVSFVHTIKALSPLFTVLAYRFYYDTVYPERVYFALVPLTVGVMLACGFDLAFNFVGLICALASTLVFVAQNIFSKGLFKEGKLDKLNMLLYSSSSSFILMTVSSLNGKIRNNLLMSLYLVSPSGSGLRDLTSFSG
jgi:solute carrier family 35 protein E1